MTHTVPPVVSTSRAGAAVGHARTDTDDVASSASLKAAKQPSAGAATLTVAEDAVVAVALFPLIVVLWRSAEHEDDRTKAARRTAVSPTLLQPREHHRVAGAMHIGRYDGRVRFPATAPNCRVQPGRVLDPPNAVHRSVSLGSPDLGRPP